jgi:hypothetical protein
MMRMILLVLILAGCADPKQEGSPLDTSSKDTGCHDADFDCYGPKENDCDDANAGVNPGATELCDGIDNDCDGAVDEDLGTEFFQDLDGDGFGNVSVSVIGCDEPEGYVTDDSDCDDTNAASWPGNTEVCDGVDNDCDGEADQGLLSTLYPDADADGYGDPSAPVVGCDARDGYVSDATDCDDVNAAIYPGARETCDAADEDCDGRIDNGDVCPCDTEYDDHHTYLFCLGPSTWNVASDDCARNGYHLVTVDDLDEEQFLRENFGTYDHSNYWWGGYSDAAIEGTWAWEDGSTSSYTHWNTGAPDDSGGGEDCAVLRYVQDYWNDLPCTFPTSYVCEAG